MRTPARTIQLFLIDGDPKYRIKATLSNWTGLVYLMPRTCLDWTPARADLNQTGVYLLFGTNDETGADQVYVGQARERSNGKGILGRVAEHVGEEKLDYFTHVIAVTTQNDSFGPTEISYLENAFYRMATDAGRYVVTNGNQPSAGKVTEEKEAELNEFIAYAKIVIGSLGYKVFEPLTTSPLSVPSKTNEPGVMTDGWSDDEVLTMRYKNLEAQGSQTTDGFVVHAGSQLDGEIKTSCPKSAIRNREKYADAVNEQMVTTRHLLFSSPSAAAAFVTGASVSGPENWHLGDGRSLREVENQEADQAVRVTEEAAQTTERRSLLGSSDLDL
ncbi:GIY-YIG nuclease family protein [Schaalia sp. ZJ405]|uniref:GIY-YIG nuclease family protein n=1 Tax=Schaalia sp. ZJ405 TaxID=2709403 RepID=UPI0013EC133A|nr:GIY-YIG nuclease family protein [Schaalia sp. ZJ405]QPK80859.1 GIY-YIG nuclease family protein [Schaalia sp. ZJ405]